MFKKMFSTPTNELGKAARFIIFQVRLWPQCAKLLRKNHAGQQAAALSYNTIFGLVPLAIVLLLVFNWLGAFNDLGVQLRDFIYEQTFVKNIQYPTDPNKPEAKVSVAQKLDEFTTGFYEKLNKGSITIIGCAIVILAAIGLLSTIEKSFNSIWHVARGRSFVHRIANYWTLLTLGPILFGVAVYINARYSITGQFKENLFTLVGPAIPFAIAVLGLFALYMLMPNAKVSPKAAVWGAFIAALVWTIAKWGFGLYIIKLIPYSVIYGVLGLIPLGVLWIYITWLIVLFGLQLTFTTQHLKTIEEAEEAAQKSHQDHFIATDLNVMNIVEVVFKAFEQKHAPVPSEIIVSRLNMPTDFTDKILDCLVKSGIILKTTEPIVGFAPSTVAENLTLADVYDAVVEAGFSNPPDQSAVITQLSAERKQRLSQCTIRSVIGN